nr:MCE family protein [Mycolicibacterium sp. CH28]
MVAIVVTFAVLCSAIFAGTFTSYVPVLVSSQRSGLMMESGAKVKVRGVQVGRVGAVTNVGGQAELKLEIDPNQIKNIPANVEAEIRATTAFGAKYVEFVWPERPSSKRLTAGTVIRSRNVSTEVNTVFQNLVGVLDQIDVTKLNSTLTALADGLAGQGERIGEATTAANDVLLAVNPRMDMVARDWRSLKGFSDTYGGVAQQILSILKSVTTTGATITGHADDLDALLLNTAGFARSGLEVLGPNRDNLVHAVNAAAPTTGLLFKYNPMYTCMLVGAKWFLDNGGYDALGGANGKSLIADSAVLFGDDPYRYPDNLPVVAAKGGPGGTPSCGSLPDASKNFPVRQLVTNTGWGTGVDWRPNPGIGHPWWVNFFPVTRGAPEPPSVRGEGPPAIGPVPYPGAPPYGAPLYTQPSPTP